MIDDHDTLKEPRITIVKMISFNVFESSKPETQNAFYVGGGKYGVQTSLQYVYLPYLSFPNNSSDTTCIQYSGPEPSEMPRVLNPKDDEVHRLFEGEEGKTDTILDDHFAAIEKYLKEKLGEFCIWN